MFWVQQSTVLGLTGPEDEGGAICQKGRQLFVPTNRHGVTF